MVIHSVPPPHPDEHLRHERNRQEEAERDARSGRRGKWNGTLSTGDKIIFLVLGVIALGVTWFLFSLMFG